MEIYSIVPPLLCAGLLLAIVSTKLFSAADSPPSDSSRRTSALDGLRGLLAVAVVFSHLAVQRRFLVTGRWDEPSSHFFRVLGPNAIVLFFMITGFLFWAKLLRARGKPDWIELYVGRLFRLGPLYLITIFAVFAVVAVSTRFRLHVNHVELFRQAGQWLALGALGDPDINGYPMTFVLVAGVTWTLAFEWKFYAALILMSPLAHFARVNFVIIAATLVACIGIITLRPAPSWPPPPVSLVAAFAGGMLAASFRSLRLSIPVSGVVRSTMVAASLFVSFLADRPYDVVAIVSLAVAFFFMANGSDLFGILSMKPVRRLGNVSYGVYLLQGLALKGTSLVAPMRYAVVASPEASWAAGFCAVAVLTLAATLLHAMIERPGIALGRRVAAMIERGLRMAPKSAETTT